MTDFLPWLYASYIEPHLQHCSPVGYEEPLGLMECDLTPAQLESYARASEFIATQAFLLGARTGAGLTPYLTSPSTPLE